MKYPPLKTKEFAETLALQLSAIAEAICEQFGEDAFFENVAIIMHTRVNLPNSDDGSADLLIAQNINALRLMSVTFKKMAEKSDIEDKDLYYRQQCERVIAMAKNIAKDEQIFDHFERRH